MMDMYEQEAIETLQEKIHQGNVDAGWWTDLDTPIVTGKQIGRAHV